MRNLKDAEQTGRMFLLCAALILAHQVAGKAVRDGLFLSLFAPGDLPKVIGSAALISVLLGFWFSRLLARFGPMRIVPGAYAFGSLLHLMEYSLLRTAGEAFRGAVVTVVYLHLVGFGAILLSGFWSVANEVFDPRAAKRQFGRIAGAGTVGGICGGLLAERGAALFGPDSLLLLLASLHLTAAFILRDVARQIPAGFTEPEPEDPWKGAVDAFRQAPFLVNLAMLVLLGTVSAALLDYLFKSGAAATYGKGPQLTRYFALFYTGSQVLTFAVQSFLTPSALRRLGLGRTMQWHFTMLSCGAGASILFGPLIAVPVARFLELVLRGSFLRASYELFFTPVPPREKRATKTVIDVGCDRLGDAVGAGVLQLFLLAGPSEAVMPILITTAALGLISFWMTRRMDAAYRSVLERGLLSRAVALNVDEAQDSTTLAVLLHTAAIPKRPAVQSKPPATSLPAADPVLVRLADLRSGVPLRVRAALAPDRPFDASVVPFAIRLLAWSEAFDWARAFLLRHAHRAVGQLVDSLLDQEQDVAVRRRIPHILAYTSSQRAVDGLTAALEDPRFEIRFHCSRAIEFLLRMSDGLRFDHAALLAAVQRELSGSRSIWEGRQLLDSSGQNDSQYWFLDEVLRDRADKSLEHVFSLLAVPLPAEPLKVAFRALHSEDRLLRALALEFLESHLSREMVSQLRRLVNPVDGGASAARPAEQVLTDLMSSQNSIAASIRIASGGAAAGTTG